MILREREKNRKWMPKKEMLHEKFTNKDKTIKRADDNISKVKMFEKIWRPEKYIDGVISGVTESENKNEAILDYKVVRYNEKGINKNWMIMSWFCWKAPMILVILLCLNI